MVDVGSKPVTSRRAIACGEISMAAETLDKIRAGTGKRDVLGVARLAGIMGAKQTAKGLIPLCHPLGLDHVAVDLELDDALPGVRITATCTVTATLASRWKR